MTLQTPIREVCPRVFHVPSPLTQISLLQEADTSFAAFFMESSATSRLAKFIFRIILSYDFCDTGDGKSIAVQKFFIPQKPNPTVRIA
ncbi:hypothetical protein TNCV_1118861 [Trichonephila clavipes]|uniref:Uncharacterized protein n=1 Tax=Trichonephila clavipes TaxID=2585209 RepID=A0A8X6T3L6_TRICX|nr:hypothetical protein TNCV_1118861 [Trichonephila clavipes]